MLTHSASVQLRYGLLLNALAALTPTLLVKGRGHDPLMNAQWLPHENHSAVFVVLAATLLGTVLVYLLRRRRVARWWTYCLCGAVAGVFPGLFYLTAMPRADWARAPAQWSANFVVMMVVGFLVGTLMGLVTFGAVGRQKAAPASS
jgi:predicted membrane channel-forming protein YqfA (hemolysin III family)